MKTANGILFKATLVTIEKDWPIQCRDSTDIKFLALALEAKAACLISGDHDLNELHPFHSIPILSASAFLNWVISKKV